MERKSRSTHLASKSGLELKKHVAVIHSNNKLSLLQRKIANALLFNAYQYLQTRDEHTIHIGQLCELIGYDSHDHKTIKRSLVNLLSTVLEWNLVDGERLDSEGEWNASSIIADASIKGAMCTYSYSNKMRKLLYKPLIYGRLDMQAQAHFQSSYGLALYENCNRFQEIGQTPWFQLEKFRKLMGVGDGKYKIFRDFKSRVLDKAVEEVNKYASFNVSAQLRRENRKVKSIQFIIQKSTNDKIKPDVRTNKNEKELIAILKLQFGLSKNQIQEALAVFEKKYIQEKIEIITSSTSFKKGKVKNLSRYLLSALKNDYQVAKTQIVTTNSSKSTLVTKEVARIDVVKHTEFKRFQDKELYARFNSISAKARSSLLKKFEKFLTGMYHHVYLRSGLENLLVQEQLFHFLHHINHELTQDLITYEKWCEGKN